MKFPPQMYTVVIANVKDNLNIPKYSKLNIVN